MPIIKSAVKKLKQDKLRTAVNRVYRNRIKEALKKARAKKTKKSLKTAYSALDRGAKKKVIHKNKAARLKSRLVKLIKNK
ncbi:MAG: 30S ribosomal protein S20 [Candidatus Beckwithbacteria bacterium]|nr:30S ribosomal protein S20 [Patescibacteria group bacterium]